MQKPDALCKNVFFPYLSVSLIVIQYTCNTLSILTLVMQLKAVRDCLLL